MLNHTSVESELQNAKWVAWAYKHVESLKNPWIKHVENRTVNPDDNQEKSPLGIPKSPTFPNPALNPDLIFRFALRDLLSWVVFLSLKHVSWILGHVHREALHLCGIPSAILVAAELQRAFECEFPRKTFGYDCLRDRLAQDILTPAGFLLAIILVFRLGYSDLDL